MIDKPSSNKTRNGGSDNINPVTNKYGVQLNIFPKDTGYVSNRIENDFPLVITTRSHKEQIAKNFK